MQSDQRYKSALKSNGAPSWNVFPTCTILTTFGVNKTCWQANWCSKLVERRHTVFKFQQGNIVVVDIMIVSKVLDNSFQLRLMNAKIIFRLKLLTKRLSHRTLMYSTKLGYTLFELKPEIIMIEQRYQTVMLVCNLITLFNMFSNSLDEVSLYLVSDFKLLQVFVILCICMTMIGTADCSKDEVTKKLHFCLE